MHVHGGFLSKYRIYDFWCFLSKYVIMNHFQIWMLLLLLLYDTKALHSRKPLKVKRSILEDKNEHYCLHRSVNLGAFQQNRSPQIDSDANFNKHFEVSLLREYSHYISRNPYDFCWKSHWTSDSHGSLSLLKALTHEHKQIIYGLKDCASRINIWHVRYLITNHAGHLLTFQNAVHQRTIPKIKTLVGPFSISWTAE